MSGSVAFVRRGYENLINATEPELLREVKEKILEVVAAATT